MTKLPKPYGLFGLLRVRRVQKFFQALTVCSSLIGWAGISAADTGDFREYFNAYKMSFLVRGRDNPITRDTLKTLRWQIDGLTKENAFGLGTGGPWYRETFLDEVAGSYSLDDFPERLNKWMEGAAMGRPSLALNFGPTENNTLKVLAGRQIFWPEFMEAIENANTSIHIHVFGMQGDDWGWEIARALVKKVELGVKVRILTDGTGARILSAGAVRGGQKESEALFKYYRDHGVEVIVTRHEGRFHYDHRKYFIFDGRLAFVTGYTLEKHMHEKMFDMAMKAEGDLVRQLQASFFTNWIFFGGSLLNEEKRDLFARYFPEPTNHGRHHARMLVNVPGQQHRISEQYLAQIRSARKEVIAISPYFVSNCIARALAEASKKNHADVTVITPYKPENKIYKWNTDVHYLDLVKAGVNGYLFVGPEGFGALHAKALLTEKYVSVGSCNFDDFSLYRDYDLNIESTSPEVIEQARRDAFGFAANNSLVFSPEKNVLKRIWMEIKAAPSGLLELLSK